MNAFINRFMQYFKHTYIIFMQQVLKRFESWINFACKALMKEFNLFLSMRNGLKMT